MDESASGPLSLPNVDRDPRDIAGEPADGAGVGEHVQPDRPASEAGSGPVASASRPSDDPAPSQGDDGPVPH